MAGKFRVLSLFSGIGGWDLGLERSGGFRTVRFCEIDPFCQRILAKHWPDVPCHDDVTTMQFQEGEADVIAAGWPCQDLSFAGLGAGLAGERSGLYREVVRAIRVVRPRLVLLENVAALLSRGLGQILGELAKVGYDAESHCIPASAIGAPHVRDRIWIIAHPQEERCGEAWRLRCRELAEWISNSGQACVPANAWEERIQGRKPKEISGLSAFSWCKNVRRTEDLRGRSDLPPPLFCGTRDGIPNWVDRIGAIGNAVVPQIPEIIGRAILSSHPQGNTND